MNDTAMMKSPTTTPMQQSPVAEAIQEIDHELDLLQAGLGRHIDAVAPVLNPGSGSDTETAGPESVSSELVGVMRRHARQIRQIRFDLASVTDRVEF